jgi:predicted dehydrogenase
MVEYGVMQKPVKVAVVGAGKLGSKHAQVYSKIPGVELVAVCDHHDNRAKEIAGPLGARPCTDYRELLTGGIDAASIVVPSSLHYAISKEFIARGVHLLIEKPFTTELAHADELLSLAAARGTTIQVGHIERFNAAIRAVKDVIKAPRFIECHRLGPYDPRVADVGVTLDLMIHDIDIVLDLVKSPVQSVDAVGAFILSKTEDIANARLRFANRSVCDLTASRVTPDVQRKIRIFQDDAYISLDYVTQEAAIFTKKDGRIHQKTISITKSDSLREELTDFIDCVRSGKRPLVSGREGRDALALALEIARQVQESNA